jgi:prepilin-type N-terminal cleavage/methylation domain-containing protein
MKRGYTLVELLIVIVIIGILTTIAFVGFGKIQADARDKERSSNATIIAEALEKYYDKNGEYPSVPAVTNTNVSQVKTLLGIVDSDVLVMPKSTPGTTTSLVADPDQADVNKVAYDANSVNQSESNQCVNGTSADPLKGGCDEFTLKWKNETGDFETIDSRHNGRDTAGALSIPKDPVMTAALSSGNVVGTVTFDMTNGQPICTAGTVGYKIISSTSPLSNLDWSTVSWQPTNTKTVPSAVLGTQYFFYAIARCSSGASGEAVNPNVANDSFYYTVTTMTAAWSGTSATGTISTSAPPICSAGLTAKYFIEYKIDTVSAAGTWTTGQSWTTSPTYTIANANTSNPRTFSFRGQVRCDNGATPGTPSGLSNVDYVISAPAAPVVSDTSTSTLTTWTWPNIICPVGTTVVYKGTWTGDYNNYPVMASTISSGINLTSTLQGFTYGLKTNASCGAPSTKVLSSTSNDSTYYRSIPRAPFRTAKAATRTYRPSGAAGSTIYALARLDTLQPESGNSYVSCASGLTRVVGWATSRGGSWSPDDGNATVWADPAKWVKDERPWSYDTSQVFYYASDLDNGSIFEARFLARCKNSITGKYSPPARDDYPYDDRIGNLQVTDGSNGQYHVICDITGSAGHSLKRPIWCSSGSWKADGSANDEQCHTESPNDSINGTMVGCWSKRTASGSYTWSFTGNTAPNVNDPSNAPYDGESGYDAPDTWGRMK